MARMGGTGRRHVRLGAWRASALDTDRLFTAGAARPASASRRAACSTVGPQPSRAPDQLHLQPSPTARRRRAAAGRGVAGAISPRLTAPKPENPWHHRCARRGARDRPKGRDMKDVMAAAERVASRLMEQGAHDRGLRIVGRRADRRILLAVPGASRYFRGGAVVYTAAARLACSASRMPTWRECARPPSPMRKLPARSGSASARIGASPRPAPPARPAIAMATRRAMRASPSAETRDGPHARDRLAGLRRQYARLRDRSS